MRENNCENENLRLTQNAAGIQNGESEHTFCSRSDFLTEDMLVFGALPTSTAHITSENIISPIAHIKRHTRYYSRTITELCLFIMDKHVLHLTHSMASIGAR